MNKRINQITISDAIELAKKGVKVFVMKVGEKPVVKKFNSLTIGDAFNNEGDYIFFTVEEAKNEK